MELKSDPGSSSDSFSSSQVFVPVFLTVGGGGWYYTFGSGTKLFVTDEAVVKPPVVSVYPAAPRAQLEGKSSLLCVASDMFPPLVQISWKRRKGDGGLEVLPPAEGEQLELRKSRCTTSVLKLRQKEEDLEKYVCSVKYEGGIEQSKVNTLFLRPSKSTSGPPEPSRPPETEPTDLPALQQTDLSFQSQCRVKLLSVLYSLLIVKSLVYCCGLSLLRILTNKPPSISCTCAD